MPQIGNIVAVAYADRFGKDQQVKIGRITEVIIPHNCEGMPEYYQYKIQVLSGARTSTVICRHSRFKTLEEIREFE